MELFYVFVIMCMIENPEICETHYQYFYGANELVCHQQTQSIIATQFIRDGWSIQKFGCNKEKTG